MFSTDQQTLHDLEFAAIKLWLEKFCIGPTALKQVQTLQPRTQFQMLRQELKRLDELRQVRVHGEKFPLLEFEELLQEIKLLGIQKAVISLEGFRRIYLASELVNSLVLFFENSLFKYPLLEDLTQDVYYTKEITNEIDQVFDRNGQIKDDASVTLAEIRARIRVLRNQINKNFDKELRRYNKEKVLAETLETFVNERRVLTVLSTFKRKVPGNIHGSSKTGSLTFIEPLVNVPLNNELEFLFDDERKEIHRILQALTGLMVQYKPLIEAYQLLLTRLDFLNAKCKLALDMEAVLPAIGQQPGLHLKQAYHPLLRRANSQAGKATFAQEIKLQANARMLVISGPNAGGKSITLKTVGLLQLMLQSGLLVPVAPDSQMCFFKQIYSDIGDNQSIENELSTYSYRLQRMKYFLGRANGQTLLLLDEFGTGSDPELGAALAEVFFEQMYALKSFAVITTHYSNIKLKADELLEAKNGCMLFNEKDLSPLYQFSLGQPGSSFTFEVAQLNGISKQLIAEAKQRLNQQKVRLDKLLSSLQKERNTLLAQNKRLEEAAKAAERSSSQHAQEIEKLQHKQSQVSQVQETSQKQLQAGKKMLAFIERFNATSRKKEVNTALFQELTQYLRLEKSKQNIKKKAPAPSPTQKPTKKEVQRAEKYAQEKIKVGSKVQLIQTNRIGLVEEIKGKQLTVIFGLARIKVSLDKLRYLSD
ncbi:MAG: endonuclease MutS2 [Flavobacteriales bacterium]